MVELEISGRRIIPVRAVPAVTGHDIDALHTAQIFACKVPKKETSALLDAYHLEPNGNYHKMLPRDWDVVVNDLERIFDELGLRGTKSTQHNPAARIQTIKALPEKSFAWWEEFVTAHSEMFPVEFIQRDYREGYHQINEHPYLDPEIVGLVYKGFESLIPESVEISIGDRLSSVMSDRDIEIGAIAQRIKSEKGIHSYRKLADEVWVARKRSHPKPERLRKIISEFQKLLETIG